MNTWFQGRKGANFRLQDGAKSGKEKVLNDIEAIRILENSLF
jgi:hypothetical protein